MKKKRAKKRPTVKVVAIVDRTVVADVNGKLVKKTIPPTRWQRITRWIEEFLAGEPLEPPKGDRS